MNYKVSTTRQFEKDVKLAKKRGLAIAKLVAIVETLSQGKRLPPKCSDHPLRGDFEGKRECHVQPDWLLVYSKDERIRLLKLIRTGTHSDLFGK